MQLDRDPQGILIVDDNPTNLEVLSDSLSQSGFQIAVAIDGESALEQVSYHKPELILLDVMMPGIDGFETCRRLKANPETFEIPVIFMTALSDAENKVKGLSLGAIDYITKPFQHEEVLARVRIHLKIQNLARTLQNQNVVLKEEIERREKTENQLIEANRALEDLNQHLEVHVASRTKDLSQALEELKQTQVALIQQEKLSALGQLVAGVAHEINNPVNFIHGNISHADEYSKDLLRLVRLYQKYYPQPEPEISAELETVDVDFLAEDLPKLMSSMEIGTDRIRDIVLSLRIFSRLDEAEVKDVDLHEGIDSTLLILGSRLKGTDTTPAINVVKEYGDLPKIRCYSGQLNQVFMNIFSNAIDALEDKAESCSHEGWSPEISVRTDIVGDDEIQVTLADNGPGIPDSLREKIFDPFFTTKPVGKGTGLGMSISYEIVVEKHHGTLTCEAAEPQGTSFIMTIPMEQEVEEEQVEGDLSESLIEA